MCGIVGYVGKAPVTELLLESLGRLEYRGYDSAGVAVLNSGGIQICKRVGKIKALAEELSRHPLNGHLGVGHCLTGDTLIQLADGRAVRIDSIEDEARVVSFDPTSQSLVSRRSKVWAHPAPEHLIQIQIPFGTITCTPQHRLFSVGEDGRVVEKRADEIHRGDLLIHAMAWKVAGSPMAFQAVEAPRYYRLGEGARAVLRRELSRTGRAQAAALAGVTAASVYHLRENDRNVSETVLRPLSECLGLPFPLPDAEPVDSHHGSFVRFPEQSSAAVMQWLGYLLGDGHVGRRGVRFKDAESGTLAVYQRLSEACFSIPGRLVPLQEANAHLLELNSLGLADWVRTNILTRRTQFLDDVGALPEEQLAAFLRGLFDAEGTVARQAGQVAFGMTDIELVRRVQLWLLRFGIVGSLHYAEAAPHQRRQRPVLKVLMTRHDALVVFQRVVGFSSARKQQWLEGVIRGKSEGHYLSSRAVPLGKTELLRRLHEVGLPREAFRRFRGGHRLTDGQAAKLVSILRAFPQAASIAEEIQHYLDSQVRYQEILQVRQVAPFKAVVYDLEVEGVENFFANGILSHNSRWATHGEPSEANAHPHTDCTGRLALVHNGIIENYQALKDELLAKGHAFTSKTDTEVLVHLVEELAKQAPLDRAFRDALKRLRGSYAVCLLSTDAPDRLFGARRASPLIVGVGKGEAFFASDVPAILARTRRVVYLNDDEIVELSANGPKLSTLDAKPIARKATTVEWTLAAAQKGGYPHFMLKEIHEQPAAIEQTLINRLNAATGEITFDRRTNAFLSRLSPAEQIVIIACGTAHHAALVGEYMLEEFARLPVDVDLASEFRYRGPMLDRNTTVIAITQSGETADTLAGVRMAKAQGAKVLTICNVMGSSIAREADAVLYTHAGPEIAVASTKAYTAQLTALLLLTLYLAKARRRIPDAAWRGLLKGLAGLPQVVERALAGERAIKAIAKRYAKARNFYFLGRRYNYPSALEGALKLKEVCPLIHAEGYAAGEMKHGPISLIRQGWPVVFLATRSPVYEKVVSNIEEVRARRGNCLVIASEGDAAIKRYADSLITIPETEELFSPIVAAVPLQLFAYHVAVANRCDVDQPPNLAKSVTVE